MRINTDNQIIQEKLKTLPQSVRDAIARINYKAQIEALMTKYNLRVDQAGILDTEIMLVLLGLEHPDSLAKNLTQEGRLERNTAEAIMRDLNENIFKQIRHELVELYEKEKILGQILGGETPASQPTATPTAPTQPAPQGRSETRGLERTMSADIAQTKLEQSFRMPPSSATVSLATEARSEKQEARGKYSSTDPYREPIK